MGTSIAEFNLPFQNAINGLLNACPGLSITSGYRTEEEQARLYAQKPHLAAPPGRSNHGRPHVGAVDLAGDLDCAHRVASNFGLHFPMDHEPWHIELIDPEAAGMMDQQAYTDPVEQRMVDIEQMLFGDGQHLNSPIFAASAEEARTLYQEGKPDEGGVVPDVLGPEQSVASLAASPGTMAQATGAEPYPEQQAAPQAFSAPQATGPGGAQGSGGSLSPVQAASYLAAAGFSGEALVTAVAIAIGESGLRADAHGDTSIAGNGWGHSIGLMQIRSRTGEAGSGAPRDPTRLEDPLFNARAAYEISGGGTNFGPWTVFTKGLYRNNMETARQAVAEIGGGGGQPQTFAGEHAQHQATLNLADSPVQGAGTNKWKRWRRDRGGTGVNRVTGLRQTAPGRTLSSQEVEADRRAKRRTI